MAEFRKVRLSRNLTEDNAVLPQPFNADCLVGLWDAGETVKTDPKSSVVLLEQDGRKWLAKRALPSPGKALLYRFFPISRALNRLRGSEMLEAAGIPCGPVIAYYELRSHLYSLQKFVPNNGSMLTRALEQSLDFQQLEQAIALLGDLHRCNLSHGDAKFGNILLDVNENPLFVDLDGVRRVGPYNRWQPKDLARFLYEVERFFPTANRQPLIDIYRERCGDRRSSFNIKHHERHYEKIAARFARRRRPTKEFQAEKGQGLPANVLFLATSKRERRYFEKLAPHFSGNCEIVNLRKMPLARSLPPMFDAALFDDSDRWFDFKLDKTFGPGRTKVRREIYRLALKFSSRFFLRGFSRVYRHYDFDALVQWNGFHYLQQAARSYAESCNVTAITMEHGYLPETLAIDASGVNYDNEIPRETSFYRQYTPRHTHFKRQLVQRRPVKPVGNEVELPEQFLFVPFQVANDSQILVHSPQVKTMDALYEWLLRGLGSLPEPWKLVIKEHPSCERRYPHLYQHSSRILFANANNTQELIERSAGIITINSTVGIESLMLEKPVITLGKACYNVPELVSHVGSAEQLAELLAQPDSLPMDVPLANAFIDYLATDYLVPGKRIGVSDETSRLAANRIYNLLSHA